MILIELTEDELVRVTEVAARLAASGDYLGDIQALWIEFRALLTSGLRTEFSPELQQRLDDVFPRLLRELNQAIELEELFEHETETPAP